ncbi:hypothetical protein [Seonamhaeicola aphaedonensis]|uniref:Uncharacterized protein n=1 Tax=Seonamhaeicola aphaedonensis TaxID=1461338 RepID=A0A3D9H5E4_9FLAO|nr:hypothetical protein [Seonamhaeicola aphaedonensis]RED44720.1 hypothetical protein DFQ02_11023 [Seonamhaeicola aphaedonensis]
MKKLKLLQYLILIVSSLLLTNCTNDYIAIPGEDGINGEDGIDGVDGVDGADTSAEACINCHSSSHRSPIWTAYDMSAHGVGSSWARGTSSSCAQCHNNEGYIDYLSGKFYEIDEDTGDFASHPVTGEPIPSANPNGYAVSNPISCTGCHSDHRSFDFENDGNDYALRNIDPVKLVLDPSTALDLKNDADPLGLSNACITCHQPRPSYPIPAGTDNYEITSSRFGPHHGPQSTMLQGIMGAPIAGSTGYPGVASATHRTGASCTTCHMGPSDDNLVGGHTWKPTLNTCTECHTNMTAIPDEIAGFSEDMETLKNLLLALNPSPLLENDRTVPGTYSADVAKATWNYRTALEDQSKGIHNPAYTRALLKNSIEALQNL